jgi:hypothetical protein
VKGNCYPLICYISKGLWLLLAVLIRLDLSLAVAAKALLARGRTKTANKAFASLYLDRHGSPPYSILEAFNPTTGRQQY